MSTFVKIYFTPPPPPKYRRKTIEVQGFRVPDRTIVRKVKRKVKNNIVLKEKKSDK